MKLLDNVGDAILTKLVPGIDVKANCGRCNEIGREFFCVASRCCQGGYRRYAQAVYDLCGRRCAWHCTVISCDRC